MNDLKLQLKTERERCQLGAGQACQFLLPPHPRLVLPHLPPLIRQTQNSPNSVEMSSGIEAPSYKTFAKGPN